MDTKNAGRHCTIVRPILYRIPGSSSVLSQPNLNICIKWRALKSIENSSLLETKAAKATSRFLKKAFLRTLFYNRKFTLSLSKVNIKVNDKSLHRPYREVNHYHTSDIEHNIFTLILRISEVTFYQRFKLSAINSQE